MTERERNTSVNPRSETIPADAERTLATPRFDNSSIQQAQPAVPLTGGRRAKLKNRSWPLSVVAVAVVAALAGGVLGGIVLTRYRQSETTARTVATPAPAPADDAAAEFDTAATGEGEDEGAQSAAVAPAAARSGEAPRAAAVDERAALEDVEEAGAAAGEDLESTLRGALGSWIDATNARDIGRQMQHYDSKMRAFYLTRDVPREAVRKEKSRVFSEADVVDVRASEPTIRVGRDGRTAVMRFRKRYKIEGGGHDRKGEVLQELRWLRTKKGWKIMSERDLRVID